MGLFEDDNESWAQSEKKLQEIIKDHLQFERDIELKLAHCGEKTKVDRASNKKRTIVAKFLNFKDKQEVLSQCKTRKLWIKKVYL